MYSEQIHRLQMVNRLFKYVFLNVFHNLIRVHLFNLFCEIEVHVFELMLIHILKTRLFPNNRKTFIPWKSSFVWVVTLHDYGLTV